MSIITIDELLNNSSFTKTPSFYKVFGLNATQKHLMALLESLSKAKGFCWATTTHLAEHLDTSEPTVSRHLKALEDKNLIRRETVRNESGRGSVRKIFVIYREVEDWVQSISNFLNPVVDEVKQVKDKVVVATKEVCMKVMDSLNNMKKKREEYSPKTALAKLEYKYKNFVSDYYGFYTPPLSGKEKGYLKSILAKYPVDTSINHVENCFKYWGDISSALKDMGVVSYLPDIPNVGVIAAHINTIVTIINDLELGKSKKTKAVIEPTKHEQAGDAKSSENEKILKEMGLL